MPRQLLSVEEVLALLESGPGRIASITHGLTEVQLHTPPAAGEWPAVDVLAHMRSCQDVWSSVVMALRSEGHSARNVTHPRTYIDETNYRELGFVPSLEAFAAGRTALMEALSGFAPEVWQLTGPARGWTLISGRTLIEQAGGVAHHEGVHIEQIEATVRALRA